MAVELALIIPTRGRPKNIERVISAWDFTGAWDIADMVLVIDEDDPEYQAYVDLADEFTRSVPGAERALKVLSMPVWVPMVEKLNAAAVAMAESEEYFAVGFAGDDHLPQTINWAKVYVAKLRELGTGMVYGDDGYQGRKLSTEWCVTADAVLALGRMVPAPVEHLYCDNAMMDLYGGAGAMAHLPQVRIEHMHPIAGKAQSDAQYKRVNDRSQFKKDRDIYESWKNGRLSADIATLKALAPDRLGRHRKETRRMPRSPFPHHFKQVPGATPEEIGIALADFAIKVPADQEIVELGVYRGRTALQMAWGARQGNGAHVTGIDPWDLPGNVYDPPFTDPGSSAWARHWVQSLGFSSAIRLIQAFSAEVASVWEDLSEDKKVGLLFVDGDHTKAGARRDIEAWAPHLAPGAIIAVDDYGHPDWPGVGLAVDELVDEGFLAPIELYHDRLAVTRLRTEAFPTVPCDGACDTPADQPHDAHLVTEVRAVTSEGVSPSPYPAAAGQVAVPDDGQTVDLGAAPTYVQDPGHPLHPMVAGEAPTYVEDPDVGVSRKWADLSQDESIVLGVHASTLADDLNTVQLRALAKHRGIALGIRKDKRADMLDALAAGK